MLMYGTYSTLYTVHVLPYIQNMKYLSTWSIGVICQFCFDYSVTLCRFLTQPLCPVCLSEQWPWAVLGRLWVPRAGSWVGVSAQNIWLPRCRSFTRTVLTTVPHLCRWEISVFTGKYPCMMLGLQCFNVFFITQDLTCIFKLEILLLMLEMLFFLWECGFQQFESQNGHFWDHCRPPLIWFSPFLPMPITSL